MEVTTDDVVQWVGFVGVVTGNYFYVTRPAYASFLACVGAVALAVWCTMQRPIPLGVLSVQMVVAGISFLNFRRTQGWFDI